VTDEQIRLYAVARTVVPRHVEIRTIAEPAAKGTLYTIVLTPPEGDRRWFAVHSLTLDTVDDDRLALEIRAAVGG
jgi:hypothetical protein